MVRLAEDDLPPPVVIEEIGIIGEDDVEPEAEVADDDDDHDRAITLELVAITPPPRPGEARLARGSSAIVPPHLVRRYERMELSVADILRGVCGKR